MIEAPEGLADTLRKVTLQDIANEAATGATAIAEVREVAAELRSGDGQKAIDGQSWPDPFKAAVRVELARAADAFDELAGCLERIGQAAALEIERAGGQ